MQVKVATIPHTIAVDKIMSGALQRSQTLHAPELSPRSLDRHPLTSHHILLSYSAHMFTEKRRNATLSPINRMDGKLTDGNERVGCQHRLYDCNYASLLYT